MQHTVGLRKMDTRRIAGIVYRHEGQADRSPVRSKFLPGLVGEYPANQEVDFRV